MDESTYLSLAEAAFRAIGDGLDAVDPDLVDCETAGDVVTLTFANGRKCIVNTQRPTRQIWLAANARAWHFSWDAASRRWLDDKGRGEELFATLAGVLRQAAGVEVTFG
jgi:CyaY protein